MANSVNKNTQNVRKTSTTGKTGAAAKGSANPKKSKRRMKKQVRKTIAGLLLASAVVVAAIPTPEIRANMKDPVKLVKVANYTSSSMDSYEDINGNDAPYEWRSKVPYVDPSETIFTTSTAVNDAIYRFAYIEYNGEPIAVILGQNTSRVEHDLVIDETVDAYKKYGYNTSQTKYCAVNKNEDYLYYLDENELFAFIGGKERRLFTVDGFDPHVKYDDSFVWEGYYQEWDNGEDPEDKSKYKKYAEVLAEKTEGSGVYELKYTETSWKEIKVDDETTDYEEVNKDTSYNAFGATEKSYAICYDVDFDKWKDFPDYELYYYNDTKYPPSEDPDDPNNPLKHLKDVDSDYFIRTTRTDDQRIHDVNVCYIGRQYLEPDGGEWRIPADGGIVDEDINPENGVFHNLGSITSISFPDTIRGIGDCAFYGDGGITSVSFNSRIDTIGNAAFANCKGLNSITLDVDSNLMAIGKDAFLNCVNLTDFTLPASVYAIGDYCFEGCVSLRNVDFMPKSSYQFNALGYKVFKGCSSLESVIFPERFFQDSDGIDEDKQNVIPISCFEGCSSLYSIVVNNNRLDIIDDKDSDGDYSKSDYQSKKYDGKTPLSHVADKDDSINIYIKDTFPNNFYFEAPEVSELHDTAKIHSASFKYLNEDKFEKVEECKEEDIDPKHLNTFIVNSANELIEMDVDDECKMVNIPSNIGAYGIKTIKANSFSGNCFLERVNIPATVELIETNAFKGCHNLKDVVFEKPSNPNLMIQDNAFNTQSVDYHHTKCDGKIDDEPFLSFTGDMIKDQDPFRYAINPANNINVGSQVESYITYYSGWPELLTCRYNKDLKEVELLEVPTIDNINDNDYWKDGGKIRFPFMDDDLIDLAKSAQSAVESEESGGGKAKNDQWLIVNACRYINVPNGITTIKEGLFSGKGTTGLKGYSGTPNASGEYVNKLKTIEDKDLDSPNDYVRSVTLQSINIVDPYAFAGCSNLTGFYQADGKEIGEYAFDKDTKLQNVEISPNVSTLGIRPFSGCSNLNYVDFKDSVYFGCSDNIIYGLDNQTKKTIVECLESRKGEVGPEELNGITDMYKEAFKRCPSIVSVDLSQTMIKEIPEEAFAQTGRLSEMQLPELENTLGTIASGAFWNNNLSTIKVPNNWNFIAEEAFADVDVEGGFDTYKYKNDYIINSKGEPDIIHKEKDSGHEEIYVTTPTSSGMETYALSRNHYYYYLTAKPYEPEIYYTVTFWNTNDTNDKSKWVIHEEPQKVLKGTDAVLPEVDPVHAGSNFSGWSDNYKKVMGNEDVLSIYGDSEYEIVFMCGYCGEVLDKQRIEYEKNATLPKDKLHDHSLENVYFKEWIGNYLGVTADGTVVARYVNPGEADTHVVKFFDDGALVSTQNIADGSPATAPMPKGKSGYTFVRWTPADFTAVTEDMTIVAEYAKDAPPGPAPQPTSSGSPSPSSSSSASPSPSPTDGNNNGEATKYTVTVSGGSGSGSYPAGAIVGINAYDMGTGQTFDKWTTSTAGVGFADATSTSTFFTMPAANVAITATYKTGGADNNNQGGNNNGGNGNGGNNGNTSNPSGTRVDINKNGISNKGVAGATVSGSTDNFVVKITDDASAAQLAQTALQNAFGANFADIKYFPFDISLYDESGTTKIADTSGMSVNITMPLPDELATYAGNNKVASVLGGELEPLNSRFTTVDGVPCISFTATHFSPYVIYVDTKNLTESTIDYTPKTGDPIHPKWFLAIGLAAISLILFFKKDKRVPLKAA